MRKTFTLAAAAAMVIAGAAQRSFAEEKMIVNRIAATHIEVALDDITKITFGDDHFIILTNNGAPYECDYDDTQSIKFALETSGANSLLSDSQKLTVTYRDNCLLIQTSISGALDAAIYDMRGAAVMSLPALEARAIDVRALPNGAYVLRLNNTSFKFFKN